MSNVIQFPKLDAEMFMNQAHELYDNHDYNGALTAVKKAMVIEKNQSIELFYLLLLMETAELSESMEFFNQTYPNISTEPVSVELDGMYITVLIECFELDEAREVLQHRKKYYKNSTYGLQHMKDLERFLEDSEKEFDLYLNDEEWNEFEEDFVVEEVALLEDLNRLAEQKSDYEKQSRGALAITMILNDVDAVECSEKWLLSEYIHPLFKAMLLDFLAQNYSQKIQSVNMNWFGESRKIDLTSLILQMDSNSYIEGLKYIEQFEKNPALYDALKHSYCGYQMLLYPFSDDVITDVKAFIDEMVQMYHGKDTQLEWLKKLENYMNEIGEIMQ